MHMIQKQRIDMVIYQVEAAMQLMKKMKTELPPTDAQFKKIDEAYNSALSIIERLKEASSIKPG